MEILALQRQLHETALPQWLSYSHIGGKCLLRLIGAEQHIPLRIISKQYTIAIIHRRIFSCHAILHFAKRKLDGMTYIQPCLHRILPIMPIKQHIVCALERLIVALMIQRKLRAYIKIAVIKLQIHVVQIFVGSVSRSVIILAAIDIRGGRDI